MRISIVFRQTPDYLERADQIARALREEPGIEVELVGASNDIFDVRLNGDLIFSHSHTGRFPEVRELLSYLGRG